MLLIRQAQIDALAVQHLREFERRLINHVAEHFPENATLMGQAGLRRKVEWCIDFARGWGISSEIGIALCTDTCFALGQKEPFTVPGVDGIFLDDELDGDTKARKFCDRVMLYLEELTDESEFAGGNVDGRP